MKQNTEKLNKTQKTRFEVIPQCINFNR